MSPIAPSPTPTQVGSYELLRLIGEGSMGRVFEARHLKLGRTVAIKMLRPDQANDGDLVRRFFQEARTVNRINHPHIVQIYDFVEDTDPDGRPRAYCVMEHLAGQTLSELIAKEAPPLARIVRIADQVAQALAAAHEVGVIHRDVKPENIFVSTGPDGRDVIRVLDFGVAKLVRPDPGLAPGDTMEGAIVGTPRYMAPEQAASLDIDARVDVYGVGCLLYEMLTGRPPFDAANFNRLVALILTQPPEPPGPLAASGEPIPPALHALVMQCLEKDPALRPATLDEVRARVLAAVELSDPEGGRRAASRRPNALVAGAGLALVALCALALRPEVEAAQQDTRPLPRTLQSAADAPYFELAGAAAAPTPVVVPLAPPGETLTASAAQEQSGATTGEKPAGHARSASARRSSATTTRISRDAVLNPFER